MNTNEDNTNNNNNDNEDDNSNNNNTNIISNNNNNILKPPFEIPSNDFNNNLNFYDPQDQNNFYYNYYQDPYKNFNLNYPSNVNNLLIIIISKIFS